MFKGLMEKREAGPITIFLQKKKTNAKYIKTLFLGGGGSKFFQDFLFRRRSWNLTSMEGQG
jgi:hypothetical protein